MNNTSLFVILLVVILVIMFGIYFGVKNCWQSSPKRLSELYDYPYRTPGYAPVGSDEAEARIYQTGWLPPADDLEERGGGYQMLSGDGPMYTPKQDPFIDPKSFL